MCTHVLNNSSFLHSVEKLKSFWFSLYIHGKNPILYWNHSTCEKRPQLNIFNPKLKVKNLINENMRYRGDQAKYNKGESTTYSYQNINTMSLRGQNLILHICELCVITHCHIT